MTGRRLAILAADTALLFHHVRHRADMLLRRGAGRRRALFLPDEEVAREARLVAGRHAIDEVQAVLYVSRTDEG
jgi:hypothetical protein